MDDTRRADIIDLRDGVDRRDGQWILPRGFGGEGAADEFLSNVAVMKLTWQIYSNNLSPPANVATMSAYQG